MVFQDWCVERREGQSIQTVEARMQAGEERETEGELELLGVFQGTRTRRGASTGVCPTQHGAGDERHLS